MSNQKTDTQIKWESCCRTKNCPEVAFAEGGIYIKDDFGGLIKVSPDQFQDISEFVMERISQVKNSNT